MNKTTKDLALITLATMALTFFVWLPHFFSLNLWGLSFQEGFATIYRNFDGLEYVIIAKSFYDPQIISSLPQALPASYFASHFPGYSILIAIFAPLLGYLKSMLFVSIFSTILAAFAFYFLVRDFKFTQNPLLLSLIFLILPARWLIVHSVGSSEPTFILFTILAIYFFLKEKILFAGLFGLLAQITRPPGILLFIALVLYLLIKRKNLLKYIPLLLIPLGLFGVFTLYNFAYGDFWAYFKSGDNIHLFFPPFQVFNKDQYWVGDIWLEDIVYLYIFGFLAGVILWTKQQFALSIFCLIYLFASIFVAHRDISRYILPTFPFILIAFEKVLTSKEFKIILPLILLAIYLYAQNFILSNTAPIPDVNLFN